MGAEFRRLDCIPEFRHYDFSGVFNTEDWAYFQQERGGDYLELWKKYGLVEATGRTWNVVEDPVAAGRVEFEDIPYYEHFCDIDEGIKTRIKRQYHYNVNLRRRMQEHIQLFWGDKLILDSTGDFSEGGFADIKGYEFLFSITEIRFYNTTLVISAGAWVNELGHDSNREWLGPLPNIYGDKNCEAYRLHIELNTLDAKTLASTKIIFPHTDEVITMPLTREKIKRIMVLEYDSPKPRYHEYLTDKDGWITDKCAFHFKQWGY